MSIMCNSISRRSIQRANTQLMDNRGNSFSSNGGNASIRCNTIFGSRKLSVPSKKIVEAASNAMSNKNG